MSIRKTTTSIGAATGAAGGAIILKTAGVAILGTAFALPGLIIGASILGTLGYVVGSEIDHANNGDQDE